MSRNQLLEAGVIGTLLAVVYFFGLERFAGLWSSHAILPVVLSALGCAWFYAVARFAVPAGDTYQFCGEAYHPYEIGHFEWPMLFGAIACLGLIFWLKGGAYVLGWGLPILAGFTFAGFANDLRQRRARNR